MAKKIILFNHKGGVSKTTSTFNIGWKLAQKGYKTMLVDADPQCNLSSIFLGDTFDSYYEAENTQKCNLMDGVRSVFDGTPSPIEAIDVPTHSRNQNLYLLPGHMNISEYDPQLTFAINAPSTLTAMKNLPGALSYFIDLTAKKHDVDFVLVDLNPGLSTMNQLLFISSDAFIIPTNPDIFCEMAIKSLSRIIPQWVNWKKQNYDEFLSSTYCLNDSTPMFIGELVQRFNIRKGTAASNFRVRIEALKETVQLYLSPQLEKNGLLFTEDQYRRAGINGDYCLAEIRDFQSLGQKAHTKGVPVFALNDDELESSGNLLSQLKTSRSAFEDLYNDLVDKIVLLLNLV